jgi:hypothetical protein
MESTLVYLINTKERKVEARRILSTRDVRTLIGGGLELAYFDHVTKNALYVDGDGMRNSPTTVFAFALRLDQFLYGNGVWVGQEIEDESGDGFYYAPPAISLEDLWQLVRFPDSVGRF